MIEVYNIRHGVEEVDKKMFAFLPSHVLILEQMKLAISPPLPYYICFFEYTAELDLWAVLFSEHTHGLVVLPCGLDC